MKMISEDFAEFKFQTIGEIIIDVNGVLCMMHSLLLAPKYDR